MFSRILSNIPRLVIFSSWFGLMILAWAVSPSSYIPSPIQTIEAFPRLWFDRGLGVALIDSFTLNLEAIGIMFLLSYTIAIATAFPIKLRGTNIFGPLATIISSGRFNGFVGLPLVFTAMFHAPHKVKIALLVFGMGVFTVMSLVKMIDNIPKELYDHARTLRMGEWRVIWEVIVLGRFDEVIDILRINIAMGWMMLPMVEGRFKYEGGVGALMEVDAKQFDYPAVFCALFIILIVGLLQDFVVGYFKKLLCPYASLGLERG